MIALQVAARRAARPSFSSPSKSSAVPSSFDSGGSSLASLVRIGHDLQPPGLALEPDLAPPLRRQRVRQRVAALDVAELGLRRQEAVHTDLRLGRRARAGGRPRRIPTILCLPVRRVGDRGSMNLTGGAPAGSPRALRTRAPRSRPIALVESGPAGGVAGAARIGERIGEPNLIYLDIGGTTAKCSLVEDATVPTTTEYRIEWRPDWAGYPVMVPVVDIVEIGAGGGSIARVDAGGSIVVGPQSAGADPGPAAYGRGGTEPTVTDAKLVAGVLAPGYFLGGRLQVHPELAREALRALGEPLGHGVEALANGIIRLADASMISALKLVSVQRGRDPRDFALLVGGGGGGMHGAALGAELEVRKVIVPPLSGVFSAWGMCMTAPRADVVRTHILGAAEATDAAVEGLFGELEREAVDAARARGHGPRRRGLVRPLGGRALPRTGAHRARARSGRADLGSGARGRLPRVAPPHVHVRPGGRSGRRARHVPRLGSRPRAARGGAPPPLRVARLDARAEAPTGRRLRPRRHARDRRLRARRSAIGFSARGPLVIEEPTTTTLVHPGQALEVDDFGNLVIWLR